MLASSIRPPGAPSSPGMGAFQTRYSKEQKEAVAHAFLDRGIRPLAKILTMAQEGQLTLHNRRIEAFEMVAGSAREEIKRERRRRAARVGTGLPSMPHADAMEDARKRLLGVVENELSVMERKQRAKPNTTHIDPATVREWARAMREISHLSPDAETQGRRPGQTASDGSKQEGETRNGLAADILRDARKPPVPSPPTPQGEQEATAPSTAQESSASLEITGTRDYSYRWPEPSDPGSPRSLARTGGREGTHTHGSPSLTALEPTQ